MAKRVFADVIKWFWDGEIILDYPAGSNVITSVFIRGKVRVRVRSDDEAEMVWYGQDPGSLKKPGKARVYSYSLQKQHRPADPL